MKLPKKLWFHFHPDGELWQDFFYSKRNAERALNEKTGDRDFTLRETGWYVVGPYKLKVKKKK